MRNITRVKFLPLLFTGVLLLFLSVCDRPVSAQTLGASADTTLQPQQALPQMEQPQYVTICPIARAVDLYEQPSETAKRIATVEKRSAQTQLILAEGDGDEPWLHVAQIYHTSGDSPMLSGYVFNDLMATPKEQSSAIVNCVLSKQVPLDGRSSRHFVGSPRNPGNAQKRKP